MEAESVSHGVSASAACEKEVNVSYLYIKFKVQHVSPLVGKTGYYLLI